MEILGKYLRDKRTMYERNVSIMQNADQRALELLSPMTRNRKYLHLLKAKLKTVSSGIAKSNSPK